MTLLLSINISLLKIKLCLDSLTPEFNHTDAGRDEMLLDECHGTFA